jgi:hypothetical protein
MRPDRLLERILSGNVANVGFSDLVRLVESLGFDQPPGALKGQAKPYQVRQVASLIRRYDLRVEE